VLSPLLLNIALQGMEEAAGVSYDSRGYVKTGCPTVIVYADDFVALCHSRGQAEAVQAKLSVWLKERGLSLNKEKTRIGRISDGFDFLSFNIRRYRTAQGGKVLTRPSRDAMKKIRRRLADELRAMRGSPVSEVLYVLNPVIRGQANYYRTEASKKSYQSLDGYLWQQLYKWARRRHPKKGRKWVTARYFGPYNPHRRDRWVFGDRETGAYLHQYAWTKIVRHAPVPRQVHTVRSCPGPVLGRPAAQAETPAAGPVLADRPAGPARAVPAMQGTAAVRRPRARLPRPVGDLVRGHPQGDDPPGHHRQQHRPDETPPRTRLLRPPSPRRRTARHGAAERRSLTARAGCLSRVPRRVASTVLRRGAPENGAPYPTPCTTDATWTGTSTAPRSAPATGRRSWPCRNLAIAIMKVAGAASIAATNGHYPTNAIRPLATFGLTPA
jgi:hypothetical protein